MQLPVIKKFNSISFSLKHHRESNSWTQILAISSYQLPFFASHYPIKDTCEN